MESNKNAYMTNNKWGESEVKPEPPYTPEYEVSDSIRAEGRSAFKSAWSGETYKDRVAAVEQAGWHTTDMGLEGTHFSNDQFPGLVLNVYHSEDLDKDDTLVESYLLYSVDKNGEYQEVEKL